VSEFAKIIVAVVSIFAKPTPENNLEVSFVGSKVNLFTGATVGHNAAYKAAADWAGRVAKMEADRFGGPEVCQVSYTVETWGNLEDITIGTEEYMIEAQERATEGGDSA
tara:strand:+ start:66 stop:392 length:327 start_codon:yes stop_codon:yes gene_type:complete